MKVIIESIVTLVENQNLESTLSRTQRYAEQKVKDEVLSFVLDTDEILNIAKSGGLEAANTAIDKVLTNYSQELKSKLSSVINS